MANQPAASSQSELNAWLVEEMYEQYRDNPDALSKSWRDFFADYRPEDQGRTGNGAARTASKPSGNGAAGASGVARTAPTVAADDPAASRIRGVGARIVENMETSLGVPTATSVRDVPAKLLEVNRRIVNNYLRRTRGGKVSFTHLIAYAMVRAVDAVPAMKSTYAQTEDGKPALRRADHFGLGLAVDVENKDGSRSLLVPVIQDADALAFDEFLRAYEEIIRKIRTGKLDPAMFSGGTITVTNPGTIGTVHSIPRLMSGQAAILGVGSIDYPAGYQAADPRTIAKLGVSKVITLTSTYDHRVIQGAESGLFLKRVHELLLGEHGFYDEVFSALGLPYEPARWRPDSSDFDDEFDLLAKQSKVDQLANMYRVRGHLIADLDPLRLQPKAMHNELDPTYYGLSIWDLDRDFITDIGGTPRRMPLQKILGVLRDAYCRTIGIEYGHVLDPEQKHWIREKVEGVDDELSPEDQLWILERLNAAEAFESFLHTKYVGQKRFGIEGGESLIPLLDAVCEAAADDADMADIVMGMAHRGRLNVLSNIVGKSYHQIFGEFEGHIDPDTVQGSGDVKYHLGTHGVYEARSGNTVELHLPPNPSHLEAVNPVVEGIARAKQDRYDRGEEYVYPALPLLMHGDAAFAGQGVVTETLNLSQLRGYRTGGTIHVVINNQVGFTTSPHAARSSYYATDVAKTVHAPILHVNGDDPEAVVRVARLAFEYRQRFHRDIVIDLICYRRHGHNEADDPSFTQPQMYEVIDNLRSVRKLYTERLVRRGDISIEQAEEFLQDFEARLEEAFSSTKQAAPPEPPKAIRPEESTSILPPAETGVARDVLDRIAANQFDVPEGFTRHPKLDRIFKKARERYDAGTIDWAFGETLAFGSLVLEGTNVRLAGQDSRRGTFSQRHAVQVDFKTGEDHLPLQKLDDEQGKFFIYDSLLSEYAAVGFEYGYSVEDKTSLVAWEAQFGDFVNGAQIIIDQFIVAAEDKWGETSGLVLLLPHGFEGQGPEHSSGRIERFLTLCAEDNIQVVNCTTAAQYFHVLRRQMHREVRKPLIIFTPKSLLRSPNAFSNIDEFTAGSFRETLDDPTWAEGDRSQVQAVTLSFGKVAYDLMKARDTREAPVAVVRVEQLYPFPGDQIREILASYPNAKDVVWVQEEPSNMGGWGFVDGRLWNLLDELDDGRKLRHAARVPSASPAAGQHVVHDQELEQLLGDTFDPVGKG
ncbi:multifunctional oxoglutarate decarboxylase/oxoglutarate dehydrogenase thiamine pyrophosphate-binding subunit/dihydrolipoyllysine-residue succinyltransferase subunit [Egicoccus halophilus]|uniref:Alpha-ketoglutarate decarboxylase n=1 Tax=Egicoccus halophilus TaxID=1670830 RepID=A0A8J3ABT5_9ACTN|nr:multifunctional oxoglutarate decarboxylase/oxoglutarate dehydrogenase thiamine pyrophosphate-binding subunit/dihydrolipoyllysine-residue succinyltransferase subunit [Egicoccus halophilus]GGI07848.1 alpha-ketoglutarate decarboxylase [Egicoccus halophilus]